MEKITIAGVNAHRVLASNKVTLPIQMYNPNTGLKMTVLKWEVFFYSPVLSHPRIENLNPAFSLYELLSSVSVDAQGNGTANIYLICKTKDAPVLPTGFTVIGNLVFDRVTDQQPVSYGLRPEPKSFLNLDNFAIVQMSS